MRILSSTFNVRNSVEIKQFAQIILWYLLCVCACVGLMWATEKELETISQGCNDDWKLHEQQDNIDNMRKISWSELNILEENRISIKIAFCVSSEYNQA